MWDLAKKEMYVFEIFPSYIIFFFVPTLLLICIMFIIIKLVDQRFIIFYFPSARSYVGLGLTIKQSSLSNVG